MDDILIIILISIGSSILVTSMFFLIYLLTSKRRRLLRKEIECSDIINNEDLVTHLNTLFERTEKNENEINDLESKLFELIGENLKNLKNIGLVRYKYTDDVGGNLSFSLAIMDDKKNGLVFTNISLMDSNTLYLRKITNGVSDVNLMLEEKQAIEQAYQGANLQIM